ncbi:hypothetical protein [Ehrlichia muris]|uniref:hypothetical protein n=1 Tax=Ehrlichia muris TaxID=35795 RepID=UPI0037C17B0F
MDNSGIVGLVVGLLVVTFFVVVLYYLMRFLLKPRLHVSHYDIPRGSTVEDPSSLTPHTYLLSAFVMQDFEHKTAYNLISVTRDLRFQLFSVYCYQDVVRNTVDGCEENSDDGVNLRQNMNLCYKDLSCFAQAIQRNIDKALEESKKSETASKRLHREIVNNYEQLCQLGTKIKCYLQERFNPVYDMQTLTAYNLCVASIMTECERKLFVFNGMREAASAVGSSSLGPAK